jgi:hypothetical protein
MASLTTNEANAMSRRSTAAGLASGVDFDEPT